jgi:large subunit ribosomal protein L21
MATTYAIISLGGKQYRVSEGEYLLVDRLKTDEGKTFHPDVLFLGGNGDGELSPKGATVTAKVVSHVLGEKIRIGKYRPKKGYKRHTGFRAHLTKIEIESIGAGKRPPAAKKAEAAPAPKKVEAPEQVEAQESPAALPNGYAEMTVAQISAGAKTWTQPELEAALEYEQAHAKRKGALGALESALGAKNEEGS